MNRGTGSGAHFSRIRRGVSRNAASVEGLEINEDAGKFARVLVWVGEIARPQDEALCKLGILPLARAEHFEAVMSWHFQVAHHEIGIVLLALPT